MDDHKPYQPVTLDHGTYHVNICWLPLVNFYIDMEKGQFIDDTIYIYTYIPIKRGWLSSSQAVAASLFGYPYLLANWQVDIDREPRFCRNILSESFSHGSLESSEQASNEKSMAESCCLSCWKFNRCRRTGWTAQNLEMLWWLSSLRMEHLDTLGPCHCWLRTEILREYGDPFETRETCDSPLSASRHASSKTSDLDACADLRLRLHEHFMMTNKIDWLDGDTVPKLIILNVGRGRWMLASHLAVFMNSQAPLQSSLKINENPFVHILHTDGQRYQE